MSNKCQICEKSINREEPANNDLSHDCFFLFKSVTDLHFFQQKLLPQLESKHPNQCAKLKPIISRMETLIKEQAEPNLKKIEQVLKKFFQSKGKMINRYDEEYWISSICEDCEKELKKQIKSAVDDIERKRLELKFRAIGEEVQKILSQIPNFGNEFNDEEWKGFQSNYINQVIDKLNKEIIAERERERERESKNGKDTDWKPWIIGISVIGGLLVVGIVIYLLKRKKQK